MITPSSSSSSSIYPGYVDELEEEDGVIITVDGYLYNMEYVSARGFTVKEIESENYPKEDV